MTLNINIGIEWRFDESNLDLTAIAQYLEGISESGTVRATADKLGISYRTLWGKLESTEAILGMKLVVKSKGHGSVLTLAGTQLKNLIGNYSRSIQQAAHQEQQAFESSFRNAFVTAPLKIRLACSHDLVLEDCMQAGLLPAWDIRFMSSQKAIDAIRSGTSDIAGFHFSEKMISQSRIKELWADPRYFAMPIMRRELGLVVAHGNPLGIKGIEDLVRPEIRFINRQAKAGTRQRLDELLKAKHIEPKAIRGYHHEEFTHSGVTLAVAAGYADVTFALRSATAGMAVDFIPVGRETYCVCGRVDLATDRRFQNMLSHLAERLPLHPGYSKPLVDMDSSGRTKANNIAAIARWESIN